MNARGSETILNIETLAFGGRGVAKAEGLVVFVDGALPGQQVAARIVRKRKDFAEAKTLRVLQESPEAIAPKCPYFGECGGCRLQNLDYAAQLMYKHHQVVESLEHLGDFEKPDVLQTLPSPDLFYYRNKMEYSFGRQRWLTQQETASDEITRPRDFALGLHVRGRFDKILDIDDCYLQSQNSVEILNLVRQVVLRGEIPPYSTRDHSGFWRHLVIREGKNTGETMVNLVTAEHPKLYGAVENLTASLSVRFPEITTIVHIINRKKAQVATGQEEHVLAGPGFIKEKIGPRLFQISAHSFFQTNSRGAEILFRKVLELADFRGHETVYDLYCGAGTISLYLADKVERVVGFELVESAVKDAERNSKLNGVENCVFVQGDLKDVLTEESEVSQKWGAPDALIIDPPRAGMHARVLRQVLHLQPETIIYVSCNPTTFARDAKELCRSQYRLEMVQPVDMFPHTAHIELVSRLRRR
ncbi:MAG: 23S rRNA (uracil(1939)-C(5))-methyltransferase RlmD [bacterium]